MFSVLLSPIPFWSAIAVFLVGILIGWVIRAKYDHSDVFGKIRLEAFIQVVVFILWTVATGRAVIYDGVAYPPFFLNLFFGAVVGSLNKGFGEYLISLAKAITKR